METINIKNIAVIGAGLVGSAIAKDLAVDKNFTVTSFDKDFFINKRLDNYPQIKKIELDVLDTSKFISALEPFDFVINAVPGSIGFKTLHSIIEAGKNVIDIAFYSENPFNLNKMALDKGVTAIVDCGIAPGMSNYLSGYAYGKLDSTQSIEIYVGGLPKVRKYPFEYKAVFSPSDVIEEYTRPARLVENGNIVIKAPLTDPEILEFPKIGSLEAFNSDGLRTLVSTLNVPNMKEKTLRYVGHREKIKMLRDMGFFSDEKIDFSGLQISPLEFTSKILFPQWQLNPGEIDITIMKIKIQGTKKENNVTYEYDLYDEYSPESEIHSMARTTGYTATAFLRLLSENKFSQKGIFPPELLGMEGSSFEFIMNKLKEREVVFKETISE